MQFFLWLKLKTENETNHSFWGVFTSHISTQKMVEKGNNLDRTLRSLSSYLVENEVIEG
jgi:hypothetical protein